MKKIYLIILCMLMILSLGACGQRKNVVEEPKVVETPEPTVYVPTPTPFPEPNVPQSDYKLTFNGHDVEAFEINGTMYAKLNAVAQAIGAELSHDGDTFSFPWRLSEVQIKEDEGVLCDGGDNLYIPVLDFCEKAQIGVFDDEEETHLYCTPAAGDWELPQGYNVAVMMYHQIGNDAIGLNNTIVHCDDFEQQINYLLDNGYTPVWFEDLWNLENIEKPVILTFDDGLLDNYTEMFPIIKKYNVKVTVAPYRENPYLQNHMMNDEQIKEMSDSGLVEIGSHTLTHPYLDSIAKAEQYEEVYGSSLWLTRVTGKQPIVLIYPYGVTTSYIVDLIENEHLYRFGVKMLGYVSYNTSDSPATVWRFFPEVDTSIDTYASWLKLTFPEKSSITHD